MKQKLIAGNWKMNGSLAANASLLQAVLDGSKGMNCQVAVCVPSAYLAQVQVLLAGQSLIALGSQDVSAQEVGAFTGEISAGMLKDFAVRYTIVGHSERRQYHAETDATVALKAQRALSAGITPIVCVGETLADRQAGQTEEVVRPGLTATPEQAQEVHAVLRAQLKAATSHPDRISILYGGSMNAANAAQLLAQADIDGGLIGGAALKATDFLAIMAAGSKTA